MASRSLGTLTIDLVAKTGGFTQGMDKAQRAADQSVQKIARTLGTIGTAAAAATAAAGAALISWTGDVVDLGQELGRLAKLSNTTTQEFQKLALGARTVGVENEKFADIVKDVQDRVGDFMQTGGGPMADFFEKIAPKVGVTAEAFRDLSGPDALQLFYDSLEKANLTQSEMIFYLEAMASDTSKLIPLLKNGGAGFEAWGDEAERLGSILDDKTIKATEEMRKASARLDEMVLGLKVNVAEELLPAMESFTGLLGDPKTQDSLRTFSELLGTIAKEAVDAGGVLANFGSQYLGFLKNQGFLPADQLDELDQLQTRAEKIRNYLNKPADPATALFRGLNREAIEKELAGVEAAIKAFPFRDVVSSVTSTYFDPPARKPGGGGAGGGSGGRKAVHELPDFTADAARDLDEMVKKVTDANKEFEALAATLDGPLAEANYRYAQDQEHLNELAKVGEISAQDLAKAQENLAKQHNADVEAINAQLNPSQEYIKALQEEVLWLGATEEGQRKLEAARIAGANATEKQIEEVERWLETRDQMREVNEDWQRLEGSISDGLYDIASGSKSAIDSLDDFFDSVRAQILKSFTDDWAKSITDWFKSLGSASGGTGGGWAGLLQAIGFGGGKATGGWAMPNTLYQVNERGMEMATVRGRDYLLTGSSPVEITPNHRLGGGGGFTQNNTVVISGRPDRRTPEQIGRATGREAARAMARTGR